MRFMRAWTQPAASIFLIFAADEVGPVPGKSGTCSNFARGSRVRQLHSIRT